MISEIVVDSIIKHILSLSRKLIHEHKIEAQIPLYLKFQAMQQIRSAINIYQVESSVSNIPLDDQEYVIKPSIDSFQALTLKLSDKPIFEPDPPTLSISTTQKSLIKKHSYKKKIEVHVLQINEVKPQKEINSIKEQESLSQIYKQQMNTNSNNRHTLMMKQQIRDMTKHMFVDNFDPNEFRKRLQNQAELIEKDIKLMNKSFQIKKSEKTIEIVNQVNQNKPATAASNQRRPQYIIQQKQVDLNITLPHPKRQLTPIVIQHVSRQRNMSLN